jgi:hypothetical protein
MCISSAANVCWHPVVGEEMRWHKRVNGGSSTGQRLYPSSRCPGDVLAKRFARGQVLRFNIKPNAINHIKLLLRTHPPASDA